MRLSAPRRRGIRPRVTSDDGIEGAEQERESRQSKDEQLARRLRRALIARVHRSMTAVESADAPEE